MRVRLRTDWRAGQQSNNWLKRRIFGIFNRFVFPRVAPGFGAFFGQTQDRFPVIKQQLEPGAFAHLQMRHEIARDAVVWVI